MTIRRRGRAREVSLDANADPWVRLLDDAFEQLETEDRVLIVLHDLEGRPLAEIAEIVDRPVGTVKWRLREARTVLHRALETVQ